MLRKVELLSEGKPIFLGLMATLIVYQKEKWSGNAILKKPFQEIESRRTHYRHEFQKSLLTGLQSLGSDVSYAIQYMSIMKDFPAGDPALWQKLLSRSESNATTLLQNMSRLFFIRENFTLKDEMIRLIRRDLWQGTASIRAYILPRLLQATEEHITSHNLSSNSIDIQEEKQAYEYQALYYHLMMITRNSSPLVYSLQYAPPEAGSWGTTIVTLKKASD